jgi:hypothetical protein
MTPSAPHLTINGPERTAWVILGVCPSGEDKVVRATVTVGQWNAVSISVTLIWTGLPP